MSHEVTLVIPDVHIPYHDVRAWELTLKAIKVLNPDRLVFLGDACDNYATSVFPKHPLRQANLKYEVDATNKELKRAIRLGEREVIFCEGNHETRLERYLCTKAPELYGLINIKDLLLDGIRGVDWVPYRKHRRVGKVLYMHDCGHYGVHAARQTLLAVGTNVVFGHSHRASIYYDGDHLGDRRFAMNAGWLGDLEQVDYTWKIKTRDWIQGLGVVTQSRGMSWAQFAPILGNRIVINGKEIIL